MTMIRAKLKKPTPPTSLTDGVGFDVLKGFNVPDGFILNYTTTTGGSESAAEGSYINSTHRFQDVRDGKVPGWRLSKLQSDFSFESDDEEVIEFEDHTFTPWGEKVTVLGVPVISSTILRKFNIIRKLGGLKAKYTNPEIEEYVSEIRNFLETTYKVKSGLPEKEVLEVMETVNNNISLLLTLEKTAYIRKLFDINNPPDVTSPSLDEQLNPKNAEKVNLDSLSPDLLKDLCKMAGIDPEDFINEVSGGITRAEFEKKYGQFIKVNSVKIDNTLVTKDEARSVIEEALRSVPEEVRPLVLTHIGGADIVNQSIDDVIASLVDADYFYTESMTQDELAALASKGELELYDLRKIKIEGMDFIQGRFEILKRILSTDSLLQLIKTGGSAEGSEQSINDTVSEIIENYIDYLGGDLRVYKILMTDWLTGNEGQFHKAVYDWLEGKNTPEVKEIRNTMEAIESAHSDIFSSVTEGIIYRPLEFDIDRDIFNITELSVELLSPLLSFSLDLDKVKEKLEQHTLKTPVLLSSKVNPRKVKFIPGLYMPNSYWKTVAGKPVYVNRPSVDRDDNGEVVVTSSSVVIKNHVKHESYEEMEVII